MQNSPLNIETQFTPYHIAYINFEQNHFTPAKIYSSLEEIRAAMRQYSKWTKHTFKECSDKRKKYYCMKSFRCSQNNTKKSIQKEANPKCGCQFNVKFYMVKKDECWQVDKKMCLFHNHMPLNQFAFNQKLKNQLDTEEGSNLRMLLGKHMLEPKELSLLDIKHQMENNFPKHGEFSLKKIKNEAVKVKRTYISKKKHNKGLCLEEFVTAIIICHYQAYPLKEEELYINADDGLSDMNLGTIDENDEFRLSVLNQDLTPVHYKTAIFDDMSLPSFGFDEKVNYP